MLSEAAGTQPWPSLFKYEAYFNFHVTLITLNKPMIYKIAGVWGNHEGSMLLWILVLTIFNYFLFRLYNKENSIKKENS